MSKSHPEAMEPLLDPCRFCRSGGAFLDIAHPRGHGTGECFVYCRICKAAGPNAPTVEKAANAWNNGITIVNRKEDSKL